VGYRDDPQLWSYLRRFVIARASPCPADGGPAETGRDVKCSACGVAVHIPTAPSDGGFPPWLRADGTGRKRLRIYQRSDGALLQFDCPLGARRKRAQRMRSLGFVAALLVIAAPAMGVIPLKERSWVANRSNADAVHDSPPARVEPSPPPRSAPPTYPNVALLHPKTGPNDNAIVRAQIAPGVKRCYQKQLKPSPSVVGRMTLVLKVARSGDVEDVNVEGGGAFGPLTSCMMGVAKRAHFDTASEEGIVRVPFDFDKDGVTEAPISRTGAPAPDDP
jgi:hypothetical protein